MTPSLAEIKAAAEAALTGVLKADPETVALARHLLWLIERYEELRRAAADYLKWSQLAGSYPGHEEYVDTEATEIHRNLDGAEFDLHAALARLEGET